MRKLFLALLLAASPAFAQEALQFDSNATPNSGIAWLQQKPMTLFDLGMMELSQAATKATEGLFDLAGAVAEYRPEAGRIAITFYAKTPYSEQNCEYVLRKMRDQMFAKRTDRAALAHELSAYFVGYGAPSPDRPSTIGEELVDVLDFAVFLPGGACDVPLMEDKITYLADDSFVAPALTPEDTAKTPTVPDVAKALGDALKAQEETPDAKR